MSSNSNTWEHWMQSHKSSTKHTSSSKTKFVLYSVFACSGVGGGVDIFASPPIPAVAAAFVTSSFSNKTTQFIALRANTLESHSLFVEVPPKTFSKGSRLAFRTKNALSGVLGLTGQLKQTGSGVLCDHIAGHTRNPFSNRKLLKSVALSWEHSGAKR